MQVTINQTTIVDRGYHDSEGVKLQLPAGAQHTLSFGIAYAGPGEGHMYRVVMRVDGEAHTLRRIKDRQAAPIITPEVNRLVAVFEAAGWHAETQSSQGSIGFGVFEMKTHVTLTAEADALNADTVLDDFLAAVLNEAADSEQRARTEQAQQLAQAKSAVITHRAIWAFNDPGFRFVSETIMRRIDGVDDEDVHLVTLGPMVQRQDHWGAYYSKFNGQKDEILDHDYRLKTRGGDRPTRDDPPVMLLHAELHTVLAEMVAQGWQQVERTEAETSTHDSLFYTITYELAR